MKSKQQLSGLECIDHGSLYSCKLALHTGESNASLSHLKIWVPVLQKNGYDFCIITRTRTAFNLCKMNYKDSNIIYAKGPSDIEEIFNNLNLKIIFYLSNTGNNLHSCRISGYQHIFLGHGDSNKSSSAHNGFKIYDEVWVSGQAHIDRFSKSGIDMTGTKLKIIGQPQLAYIHKTKPLRNSFLYIPTWEGIYKEQSYSSLPIANELFCNNELNIRHLAIKAHPLTATRNSKYSGYISSLVDSLQARGVQVQIYPKDINVIDIMNEHTGYICDNSAVITNALFFNKPIFVYLPDGSNYAETEIPYNKFLCTFNKIEEFVAHINIYKKQGDIMKESRSTIIDYFISREATQNNIFKILIDTIIDN